MSAGATSYVGFVHRIGEHELLSREEEASLGRRAKGGDRAARDRLIQCNARLVIRVATNLRWTGRCYDDLLQDGFIGLIKAAEHWDPDHPSRSRFGTLAWRYVDGYARSGGGGAWDKPRVDELYVLDAPVGDGGELMVDLVATPDEDPGVDEQAEAMIEREELIAASAKLPPDERRVFQVRWGLDGLGSGVKSLAFCGVLLDLSAERCLQLERRAMARLAEDAPHLR